MALIAAHLNAGHCDGDNVVIGIYSPSSPTSIPPFPPFSPSLISLMVSVDVKHHVYLPVSFLNVAFEMVQMYTGLEFSRPLSITPLFPSVQN